MKTLGLKSNDGCRVFQRRWRLRPEEARCGRRLHAPAVHGDAVVAPLGDRSITGVGLRDGAVVALQGDRPRAGGRTVPVPFLGRTADFPLGTAVLAQAAGVPILPAFVFRAGARRHTIVFRPRIDVGAPPEAVARIAREVEWAVRREPHQWFCFRRLWDSPT